MRQTRRFWGNPRSFLGGGVGEEMWCNSIGLSHTTFGEVSFMPPPHASCTSSFAPVWFVSIHLLNPNGFWRPSMFPFVCNVKGGLTSLLWFCFTLVPSYSLWGPSWNSDIKFSPNNNLHLQHLHTHTQPRCFNSKSSSKLTELFPFILPSSGPQPGHLGFSLNPPFLPYLQKFHFSYRNQCKQCVSPYKPFIQGVGLCPTTSSLTMSLGCSCLTTKCHF